jgi:L-fucose mutarotase
VLIGIDPLLTPDLLSILRAMGHGDELTIADANFPATSTAKRLVRLDGVDASRALDAILSVLPLDSFVECAAHAMAVVGKPDEIPAAVADFQGIVDRRAGFPKAIVRLERHAFYERARQSFALVATTDRRLYANIILTKGVIGADGKVVR